MTSYNFDWADLAFASKRPLTTLKATFIAAPREISEARLTQLVKEYLPKGHIILGIAKEVYVDGLDGQPQFSMLTQESVQKLIDRVNKASQHKVYTLHYFQREQETVIDKLAPPRAVFVNGSWYHSFHTLPVYYTLVRKNVDFQLVSAFVDEVEARAYEQAIDKKLVQPSLVGTFDEKTIMTLVDQVAKSSYDNSFQTGTILAKKEKAGYKPILSAYNKVVPFQTCAMLNGASREINFSPPNDLNHYDAIHAEMSLLVQAQKQGVSLKGTTLFVNLMPCPTCTRALIETDVSEIIYRLDHSEGYAVGLFEKAGKDIRRIVY